MSLLSGYCASCHYSGSTWYADDTFESCSEEQMEISDREGTSPAHYQTHLLAKRCARGLWLAMCGTCHDYMQGKQSKHAPCDICSPSRDALRDVPRDWLYSEACGDLQDAIGSFREPCEGCTDRDCCCDCHPR